MSSVKREPCCSDAMYQEKKQRSAAAPVRDAGQLRSEPSERRGEREQMRNDDGQDQR
jgi:hypothetical protein